MFGIAEILRNLEDEKTRKLVSKTISGLWPTREDFRRMFGPIVRGTVLGSALGILPGAGHVLASFGSYSIEKRLSKRKRRVRPRRDRGRGRTESANNAAAQTSFIPLLTLGLPAHPVMALMIGAFIIHGITPGPGVIDDEPALFWGLIVSMWIGNLFLVLLNLPLIGIWVKMLTIPYKMLFPAIIAFACDRNLLARAERLERVHDRVLRHPRLRAHQARLRAGAAAPRLRAGAAAGGPPAAVAHHLARRPIDLHQHAGVCGPAGHGRRLPSPSRCSRRFARKREVVFK